MRVVLCDEDELLRSMVETIVVRQGHEIVGIADTTPAAVGLIEHARPDLAVIDLALGFNTDFDAVETAEAVGAKVIVFSHTADAHLLERYPVRPIVVPKPNLDELEHVIARLEDLTAPVQTGEDRRKRPVREASGPPPTGPGDAQAFYEALNAAVEEDGIVWVDLLAVPPGLDQRGIVEQVQLAMRRTDRLLESPGSVRVFLPGAGDEGVRSLCDRLRSPDILPAEAVLRCVLVGAGESPNDAFERLKHTPPT